MFFWQVISGRYSLERNGAYLFVDYRSVNAFSVKQLLEWRMQHPIWERGNKQGCCTQVSVENNWWPAGREKQRQNLSMRRHM